MKTYSRYILAAILALTTFSCAEKTEIKEDVVVENRVFGILSDSYILDKSTIKQGETLGKILSNYNITASQIDKLDKASKEIFPLKQIRGGNSYTAFLTNDTVASKLDYLVYEVNKIDYVVFSFANDTILIYTESKPITVKRVKKDATIESSMWGAIMEAKLPYALAAEIEEIYQWSVDFFSIKKGDNFTVIYEEKFVEDTIPVGIGRVWGAKFTHHDTAYYAIPFNQDDNIQYWDIKGGSLRKMMLKAPLKYSRISSGFTYARLHPVHKVYRPHTGVDYAAPMGTPVHAVADGVVTFKGWGGGGGNTLKIKHAGNYMTGYLHLRGFAKGISQGTRVKQGQLIGYVGSTGTSTGPHLDYRIWKNGTPINPLKVPQEPTEPIKSANIEAFKYVQTRIVAELEGDVDEADIITSLDSIPRSQPEQQAEPQPKG